MTIWTFNQSGSIPGIPGTFAGVTVDDETMVITPLVTHPEFVAAPVEEKPTTEEKDSDTATAKKTDDTAPEEAQP